MSPNILETLAHINTSPLSLFPPHHCCHKVTSPRHYCHNTKSLLLHHYVTYVTSPHSSPPTQTFASPAVTRDPVSQIILSLKAVSFYHKLDKAMNLSFHFIPSLSSPILSFQPPPAWISYQFGGIKNSAINGIIVIPLCSLSVETWDFRRRIKGFQISQSLYMKWTRMCIRSCCTLLGRVLPFYFSHLWCWQLPKTSELLPGKKIRNVRNKFLMIFSSTKKRFRTFVDKV